MQTKQLGHSNLNLTSVGLGTWAMGGGGWQYGWGPQDEKESIATIQHALELGINWIDTAPVYGLGHAEEVVGKAIKNLREKPVIATKCGLVWGKKGNIFSRLKRESVRAEVEASLKRLQIEVIDLYQIHWPDPAPDIEEAWGTIDDLIQEGKIRYAGVSNFSVEQLKRMQAIHPVASLQPPYSLLERGIEQKVLGYCAKNNIGVIFYSPIQKGILAEKFSRQFVQSLPPDDHRSKYDSQFREPALSANLQFVAGLREIAKKHGKTVAQLAIAWTLRLPEVTAAIVGARRPAQIAETAGAGDWRLSEEDLAAIDKLLEKREKAF